MSAARSGPPYVQAAAVVLENARLIYVPIPKAGSTAVLWGLLDLAEIDGEAFTRSTKLETTRALTIHDVSIWGRAHRLEGRRETFGLFAADEWFAFTVVRDPVRRLWSAWVSKILVCDPRFVANYGGEPWFPASPLTAADVVGAFRAFLATLPEKPAAWHDPHWSSQVELAGTDELSYDLIARVERLPGDLASVTRHLHDLGLDALELQRENTSLLPFTEELLDPASWERCADFTARDREAFGYAMPELTTGEPYEEWVAEVEVRLPGIHAVIQRNERIGDLKRLLPSKRAS